jgi:hypothetical protein
MIMVDFERIIWVIDKTGLFVVALFIAVLGFILLYRGKLGKIEIGNALKLSGLSNEVEEIRHRIRSAATAAGESVDSNQQYALLQEYHAQGLAQSKISFWFSLIFASIGFFIIIISILSYVFAGEEARNIVAANKPTLLDSAGKPIFAVIAGTIIDAVAALFFVQSNKARQLMTEFFDKLRIDRKLDESLKLLTQIEDNTISSRVKALLAINFAEVKINDEVFGRIVNRDHIEEKGTPNKPIQPTATAAAD